MVGLAAKGPLCLRVQVVEEVVVEELPRAHDSRMGEEEVAVKVSEDSQYLQMSSLKVCELLEEA